MSKGKGRRQKMENVLKNIFDKVSGREEERKIDLLASIVDRNKIKNAGVSSIDDVVEFAKTQKMKYDIYF